MPATALPPGSPRRVALDAVLAEIDDGRSQPSVEWRRASSRCCSASSGCSARRAHLADGTVLSAHQVDALSGTLTALLAEAQRSGNGHGNGALSAEDIVALAPVGIPGEEPRGGRGRRRARGAAGLELRRR